MWRIAAPSTCSQLLVSRLRVPGGPWGQGASSDIDPLPSWGGRAHCGGCFQRAATEFQGRATFALLALFPTLSAGPREGQGLRNLGSWP